MLITCNRIYDSSIEMFIVTKIFKKENILSFQKIQTIQRKIKENPKKTTTETQRRLLEVGSFPSDCELNGVWVGCGLGKRQLTFLSQCMWRELGTISDKRQIPDFAQNHYPE